MHAIDMSHWAHLAGKTIFRVRSSETIADPRVKALIMSAVAAARYPGTTPVAFYDEIAEGIAGEALGVFLGIDDGDPAAVAIVVLPTTALQAVPQVVLAYSLDRELSIRIGERVREWLKRHEYDRFFCINFLHDDEAYQRVFRHAGVMRRAGTVFEVMF
jgi:hypothetical protein